MAETKERFEELLLNNDRTNNSDVSATCNNTNCEYHHADTISTNQLDINLISIADREHIRKYHKKFHSRLHAKSFSANNINEIANTEEPPRTNNHSKTSQQIELQIKHHELETTENDPDEEQKYVEKELIITPNKSHTTSKPLLFYIDDINSVDITAENNQRSSVIRYKVAESVPLSICQECKIRIKYISRKSLHNMFLIILALILLISTVAAIIAFLNEFNSIKNNEKQKVKLFEISNEFNISQEDVDGISGCNTSVSSIIAWYDTLSYDHSTNTLFDKSIYKHNIKANDITGFIRLGIDQDDNYYLFGFANDSINFASVHVIDHTIVYILNESVVLISENNELSWSSIPFDRQYWKIRAIIVFDSNMKIEQCLSDYLKKKYLNSETDDENLENINLNDITIKECDHWQSSGKYKDDMVAWYDVNTGLKGNTLVDLSGKKNDIEVDHLQIGIDQDNNFKYIYGSMNDFIQLNDFIMPDSSIVQINYVGKLIGDAKDQLLCDSGTGLTIGFFEGHAANCRITKPGIIIASDVSDNYQDEWLLSTYQDFRKDIQSARHYYAQNGKKYATNINIQYETQYINLTVNCHKSSQWAITEIIMFKTDITSYSFSSWRHTYCIEKYLSNKYSIDIWEYELASLIITMPSINLFVITIMTAFIPIIFLLYVVSYQYDHEKFTKEFPAGCKTCSGTAICCCPMELFIQSCCCNFTSLCKKCGCCKCCEWCNCCCCDCCCRCASYCYNTCCCFSVCEKCCCDFCSCCCLKGSICRHYAVVNIMGFPFLGLFFAIIHCFKCVTDVFSINKSSILSSFTCFMIVLIQFVIDIMYIMDEYYDQLVPLCYNLMW
eukprot:445422_1